MVLMWLSVFDLFFKILNVLQEFAQKACNLIKVWKVYNIEWITKPIKFLFIEMTAEEGAVF